MKKFDKRLHFGLLGQAVWKDGRPIASIGREKDGYCMQLILNEVLASQAMAKNFSPKADKNSEG